MPFIPDKKPSGFIPDSQPKNAGGLVFTGRGGVDNPQGQAEVKTAVETANKTVEQKFTDKQNAKLQEVVDGLLANGVALEKITPDLILSNNNIKKVGITDLKKVSDFVKDFKEKNYFKDANVKENLDALQAINEAFGILDGIKSAKQNTPTGPFYGKIYDAAIRKFSKEGQEMPPGWFDIAVVSVMPDKAKNLRLLDQEINRLFDYLVTKGGKAITGTEKGSLFNQFPGIYEPENQFNSVLNQSFKNLQELKDEKLKFLQNVGVPQSVIDSFKTTAKEQKQNQGGTPSFDPTSLSGEDKDAYEWATQNKNDPRAKKIFQVLGVPNGI